MCVGLHANLSLKEKKEGVTWHRDSYYEMAGLHFNSERPCQGQRTSAGLPASLETPSYGQNSCSTKTHPAIIFSSNVQSDDTCERKSKLCMNGAIYGSQINDRDSKEHCHPFLVLNKMARQINKG